MRGYRKAGKAAIGKRVWAEVETRAEVLEVLMNTTDPCSTFIPAFSQQDIIDDAAAFP